MHIYITPEIGLFAEDEAASTNQHQGLERKEDIEDKLKQTQMLRVQQVQFRRFRFLAKRRGNQ